MEHNLQETIALLTRTPAALDGLLRGLPEEFTRQNEGDGTWSPADVVAHLIHAERADWIPRARMILQVREREGFEPVFELFDRWGNILESRDKPSYETHSSQRAR